MENSGPNDRLTSWKEIALYLGRDIRTCWRWEKKYGLPIHRVDPESAKSRVYAFKDELDEWLHRTQPSMTSAHQSIGRRPAGKRILYFAIPGAAFVAIGLYFFLRPSPSHSYPSDFTIEGSELVMLAKNGKELWRHDTQVGNLREEELYRDHFQTKRPNPKESGVNLPRIIIRDINNDQKPEVLFAVGASDEHSGGALLCLDGRGKVQWRFRAGREMRCGSRPYSSEYDILGLDTLDIDDDGSLETVIISHQPPNWLTQLALLDSGGRVIGEFWNSGILSDFVLEDLNKDGQKELGVVGLNNEYGKGCLIVFDTRDIAGASPQAKPEFACRGLKPGTEKYYLLFPRTDVDTAKNPVENIAKIIAEKPNILSLDANISHLIFILNFDLVLQDVTFSHAFMANHREALLAGKIHSSIDDPRYKEALMKGVLYYDGQGWTTQPTPVIRQP